MRAPLVSVASKGAANDSHPRHATGGDVLCAVAGVYFIGVSLMQYSTHYEPPYEPTITVTVRRNRVLERLFGIWVLLTTSFYRVR